MQKANGIVDDIGVDPASGKMEDAGGRQKRARASINRLTLTEFRNYSSLILDTGPEPIILLGDNGAGKTNILEALSLFSPGQGMRRSPYTELARIGGSGQWAVSAHFQNENGPLEIGTGAQAPNGAGERQGRVVRINREPMRGTNVLGEFVELVWLTPSMDRLFTGPASDRRRFLDRLIICFDPGYRKRLGQFERALRQRNKLLEMEGTSSSQLNGLELQVAEIGTGVAATRLETVSQLAAAIQTRRKTHASSAFPWSEIEIDGLIENWLKYMPAVEVEDGYCRTLREGRERDRAAKRTLAGPHRSDFLVTYGSKGLPAKVCSTGEQKALLVNLVLAHADLVSLMTDFGAPLLLLDEIAAHLDETRRNSLFEELLELGSQAWMTGTDSSDFSSLEGRAQFYEINEGIVTKIG